MNDKIIKRGSIAAFCLLIAIFVIFSCQIAIPAFREYMRPVFLLILGASFFLAGVALMLFTMKGNIKGKLKIFLLLTGGSAVGFFVAVLLHNFIYGLFIYLFGADFWGVGGDEPLFFIIAVFVCPLAFLVGIVGTIVSFFRK